MDEVTSTELCQRPGGVIDHVLRDGKLKVTAHGYAACFLVDPSSLTDSEQLSAVADTISATELFRRTGDYIEAARGGRIYQITRHRRPVMLMLPVAVGRDILGLED